MKEKIKQIKNAPILFISMLLFIVFIIFSTIFFNTVIVDRIEKEHAKEVVTFSNIQKAEFLSEIENKKLILKQALNEIAIYSDNTYDGIEFMTSLKNVKTVGGFSYLIISDLDGNAGYIGQDNGEVTPLNIKDYDFFKKTVEVGNKTGNVHFLETKSGSFMFISVKAVMNGKEIGTIHGVTNLMDNNFNFGGVQLYDESYGYITNENLDIIMKTQDDLAYIDNVNDTNLKEFYSQKEQDGSLKFYESNNKKLSFENIISDLKSNKSQIFQGSIDGGKRYCYAQPLDLNGWYLFTYTSDSSVESLTSTTTLYTICFVAFLAVIGVTIGIAVSKTLNDQITMLKLNESEIKLSREIVRTSELRYREAFVNVAQVYHQNTPFDTFLVVNLSLDFIEHSFLDDSNPLLKSNSELKFIVEEKKYSNTVAKTAEHIVRRDFKDRYLSLFSKESLLKSFAEGQDRIVYDNKRSIGDNKFEWFRTKAVLFKSETTDEVKVYIRSYNINKEKINELEITNKANRDLMTGLLNKSTVEEFVNEKLKKRKLNGFFVIDIDNLKKVNDSFGHIAGDELISKITDEIKAQFRTGDVLGRVGGDEFVALMTSIQDKRSMLRKAKDLCESINEIRLKLCKDVVPSCSIGLTLSKKDDSYQEMFKRSDIALYKIKKNSKNGYASFINNELQVYNKQQELNLNDFSNVLNSKNSYAFGLAICEENSKATILKANSEFYNIIGFTKEQFKLERDNSFSSLITSNLNEIVKNVKEDIENKKRHLDCELEIQTRNGDIIKLLQIATYDKEKQLFNIAILKIAEASPKLN